MRTRIIPKMLNDEVEEYLTRNDIVIVPVGTVEMHGGFPLDSETVVSEAFALKMAESLLRQGFKRQIYISAHGPAHMTVSPMVRDFMDKTGTPILYMDMIMQLMKNGQDIFKSADTFHAITVGAYDMLGRLEDVPLTTKYEHQEKQTCAEFDDIFALAYQSGSIGYYFGDPKDHMSTPSIPTEERRKELAEEGKETIQVLVERMNVPHIAEQMKNLEAYNQEIAKRCPWVPFAQE